MDELAERETRRREMNVMNISHMEHVSLQEAGALALKEFGPGFVFVSTPMKFLIAEYSDAGLSIDVSDASQCFSARFFSREGEVRWELTSGSTGDCVVVSESEFKSISAQSTIHISGTINHSYLCWGEVTSVDNGWSRIKSGRTSVVSIPVNADIGDEIELQTRELLAVSKEADGNTYVVDELIIGFSKVNG